MRTLLRSKMKHSGGLGGGLRPRVSVSVCLSEHGPDGGEREREQGVIGCSISYAHRIVLGGRACIMNETNVF
jgi:hypothetical protein